MCIAACTNRAGLFAARFFLGFPESGVVPACVLYFSFWYKPVERAWRIGFFHSSNALAAGVSGFVSVGIDNVSEQLKSRLAGFNSRLDQRKGRFVVLAMDFPY